MQNIFKSAFEYLFNKKVEEQEEVKVDLTPKKNKIIYDSITKDCTVIIDETAIVGEAELEDLPMLKIASLETISKFFKRSNIKDTEEEKIDKLVDLHLDTLKNNPDFEIIGNECYLSKIRSISVPKDIVAVFIELEDKMNTEAKENGVISQNTMSEYEALHAFTLKLLANPIKESRDTLMEIVKKYNVKMTNSGNIIGFRRIVSKGDKNKQYTDFVSNTYFKIKSQKKAPVDYAVYQLDSGEFVSKRCVFGIDVFAKYIGNLKELYQNLSTIPENIFTDNHTKSYTIRLGDTYKIREEDIELNKNGSCGGLLHLSLGSEYFDYTGFGDTPVVCLVNPMMVHRVDTGHSGKIGVSEMFVCCKLENENEVPSLANFDDVYEKATLEDIKNSLANKVLDKFSVDSEVTSLNYNELVTLQQFLQNRIVNI